MDRSGNQLLRSGTANVRDYGATGDGTTDDTAAIQAAFDSGRPHIFFPDGNYSTNMILVPASVRSVTGDGVLLQRTAGQDIVRAIGASGLSLRGLRFVGIGGPVPQSNNSGVHVISSNKITISDCEFSGFRFEGVLVEDSDDVRVTDNVVHDVSGGIRFTGVERAIISGNMSGTRNFRTRPSR